MKSIKTLLVCPITKQDLVPLSHKKEDVLLALRKNNQLKTIDDQNVTTPIDSLHFLCTPNQQIIYTMVNEIPVLLESKQVIYPSE